MSEKCLCKDWEKNIDKMNAGFTISFVHGLGGYSGKPIVFCPWCGTKLITVNIDDED